MQIKRYFVSFWNGVDLRYKLLKGPRIRISIAGIIISRVSLIIMIRIFSSGLRLSQGSKTYTVPRKKITIKHVYIFVKRYLARDLSRCFVLVIHLLDQHF